MSDFDRQLEKVATQDGFIAALDQSGGSTAQVLRLYGVNEDVYDSEDEKFDRVHQMRTRIVTSPAFDGGRILGAILFENTLNRDIQGLPSSSFLWEHKNVVPFLKVDKGLDDEVDSVHLMKPMPDLAALLEQAVSKGVFGTKMRSVIKLANSAGISAAVDQQFLIADRILAEGLVPIIEPEIDIHSPEKAEAEEMLRDQLLAHLNQLGRNRRVMLKLTLPEAANYYADCIAHPNVVRVVALSGGYSREEANARLAENVGMIASFSRALTQGLSAQQSNEDFYKALDDSIETIFQASKT